MCWAKESDFQKKCQSFILCLHNYTHSHQPQKHFLHFLAAQSLESGALPFFQSPDLSTSSPYIRHLESSSLCTPGKNNRGFSVAAGLAVISDACWALCFCLERDAGEGHCGPLAAGSFAVVFKQDSGIETGHFFCCFLPSLFSLCFALTEQQMP